MSPWPVRGADRRGAPAAPRPRRPRRRAEVQAERRPQHPRARLRARDRRARGRRRAVQGVPARRSASRCTRTSSRSPRCTRPRPRRRSRSEDFAEVDDSPVRCLDAEASRGDGRARSTSCARPTSRSAASSRCRPSGWSPGSARTSPGRSASTAAWRWRSARSRRSRASRSATAFALAGLPGSQAHDEIFYSSERGYYRETNRAGGLEGGMTNGQPLIVRGAMKPLPTLTKPLRSVDTATHEPAAGAARAHRLVHRARRRRRRRGDGRARARRRLPAQVRRRPHRRRARRPCERIRASAIGVALRPDRLHGGRQVDAPPAELAARCGARGARQRRAARASASGTRSPREFELHGEAAFRAREEEVVCELLARRGPGDVIALGGGSVLSERVRDALAGHMTVLLDVDAGARLGARARGRRRASAGARPRRVRRAARRAPGAV